MPERSPSAPVSWRDAVLALLAETDGGPVSVAEVVERVKGPDAPRSAHVACRRAMHALSAAGAVGAGPLEHYPGRHSELGCWSLDSQIAIERIGHHISRQYARRPPCQSAAVVADVLLATLDEATAALDTAREEWSRTYEYSAERNDLHNVPDGAVFWPWLKAAVIARARASFHDRFGGVQTNRGFPVTLSRAVARLERDGLIAVSVREDAAGRTIRIIALRRVLP